MRLMIRVWTMVFCLWALPSHAALLDPWAVTPFGTLNASEEPVNANTGMLDPVSGAGILTFHDVTGANSSIFVTRTLGKPLGMIAAENITLSGEARDGNIGLSSGRDRIVPGAGIRGRTVSLGSGIVTLTGGTISGSANYGVTTVSSTGMIIGTSGMTLIAPVPVPAAFLLCATGLAAVGLVKRRKFSRRTLA